MRPLQTTIFGLALLLLAGCQNTEPNSANYPEHYVNALTARDGIAVQAHHLQPFTAFITRLGSPEWERHFKGVYAERVHFSDTLAYINDRATLRGYFADLADNGATVDVNILSTQRNGADAYLIWEMTTSFTPIVRKKKSHTIGMTHLRFNAAGEVILHQDFWDAATGFYQHVPVIGSALRGVRARMQPAAN